MTNDVVAYAGLFGGEVDADKCNLGDNDIEVDIVKLGQVAPID